MLSSKVATETATTFLEQADCLVGHVTKLEIFTALDTIQKNFSFTVELRFNVVLIANLIIELTVKAG